MESLLHVGLSNALLATLLALLAAGLCAVYRRPALAHALWLLVLLKLVTPPLVSFNFPEQRLLDTLFVTAPAAPAPPLAEDEPAWTGDLVLPAELAEDVAAALIPDVPAPQAPRVPADLAATADDPAWQASVKPALVALWLAGAFGWFALAGVRVVRFQRLLRHARPAPASLQAEAERVARRLGLVGCPRVELVPGAVSPMLWFLFGSPRLLLPAELLDRLGEQQRATLLAHELAHLRRRDHWVRGLEVVTTGLYWWHPVVWWARHELHQAEEQCCDAWVVWALPRAARAYATALLETVDFLSEVRPLLPPAASGVGQVTLLKRRLTMIMQAQTPRALSWVGFLAVLGLAALLLPATWVKAEPAEPEYGQLARQLRDLATRVEKDGIELEVDVQVERLQDILNGKKVIIEDRILQSLDRLGDTLGDTARKLLVQSDDDKQRLRELERSLRRSGASDEEINRVLDQIKKLTAKEPKGKDKEASKADMERAKAEIKQAQEQMRQAQEQMRRAARQLAEAHRKLAKLSALSFRHNIVIDFDGSSGAGKGAGTGTGKGKRILLVNPGERSKDDKLPTIKPPKPPKAPAPPSAARAKFSGDREQRLDQLERRLSELMGEVKRLHQEMRRENRRDRDSP